MMTFKRLIPMLALAASTPLASNAQEIDLDFFLAREAGGTATPFGAISDLDFNIFVPGQRVISAELSGFGNSFTVEEPGFNNPGIVADGNGDTFDLNQVPGVALAVPEEGDQIQLNRIAVEVAGLSGAELFFWDGANDVEFTEALGVTLDFDNPVDEEDSSQPLAANEFGAFDGHPLFTLTSDDPAADVDSGVYLVSLTANLFNEDPAIESTDPTPPLFIVFGLNASEASLDAAVSFVESALAVPEPHSAALLLLASCGLVRRCRR